MPDAQGGGVAVVVVVVSVMVARIVAGNVPCCYLQDLAIDTTNT